MQKMSKAQFLLELANTGMVDKAAAITRVLEAANIDDIEELMPQPNPMDEQMAQMNMVSMQIGLRLQAAEVEAKLADATASMAKATKDVASAESEEAGRQIDLYTKELMNIRNLIDVNQRTVEGMAGPSGNGVPAGGNGQPLGAGQGGNVGPILGG
jgi:hypothetical protein